MAVRFLRQALRWQSATVNNALGLRRGPRLRTISIKLTLLASVSLVIAACATNPTHNLPLTLESKGDYSFQSWIDERCKAGDCKLDENLIVMSFSGGGLRAAALAKSVVDKLRELDLYNRVAIISSTSGGSVTAGFLAAKGADKLSELDEQFLRRDNTAELLPGVLFSLLTGSNRSQKFADYLDRRLLNSTDKPTTYDDLRVRWQDAPFVILNATDASYGHTFEFKQDTFSTLCSDLGSFRLSEAVASSAAFPILMSPVTLKNNWDKCRYPQDKIPFDSSAYSDAFKKRYVNLENYVRWRHTHSLRYTYEQDQGNKPYRQIEFIHLLDGGLSDNLAARALLRAFGENDSANIKRLIDMGVRRVLLIQVNAKSDSSNTIDMSGEIPSLFKVFNSAAMNPIDVTTALSSYISREYMVSLVKYLNGICTISKNQLYFYPVQVDFDLLTSGSKDQIDAKKISTWWTLPPSEINLLENVGKNLLTAHPCFQAFVQDIGLKDIPVDLANECREFIQVQVAGEPYPVPVVAPAPAPAPAPVAKEVITFNLLFDFDSARIKDDMIPVLERAKAILNEDPAATYVISGHTCNIGTDPYNQTLSERRAAAVKNWLVDNGIAASRLEDAGYGEARPKYDNKIQEGRMLNRRVEIRIR